MIPPESTTVRRRKMDKPFPAQHSVEIQPIRLVKVQISKELESRLSFFTLRVLTQYKKGTHLNIVNLRVNQKSTLNRLIESLSPQPQNRDEGIEISLSHPDSLCTALPSTSATTLGVGKR